MNADLIRSLVRMGLYVGYHTEHPATMEELDRVAGALATPVIEVSGGEVSIQGGRCRSFAPAHGKCVRWAGHVGESGSQEHSATDGFTWSV